MGRLVESLALVLLVTLSAHGQSSYSVLSSGTPAPCGTLDSSTPVSVSNCLGAGGCIPSGVQFSNQSAESSSHRVWARSQQNRSGNWNSCGAGWLSSSDASHRHPFTVSGPGPSASVCPRVAYEAVFEFDAVDTPIHANASFFVSISFNGSSVNRGVGVANYNGSIDGGNGLGATIEQIGPKTWRAYGILTFPSYGAVSTDVPFNVSVGISVSMQNGDFGCTVPLPSCSQMNRVVGTAHILDFLIQTAGGYTVNSPAAHLVNNQWIDPSPSVATSPSDACAELNSSAIFSVTAAGTGPFTYQWRRNGIELSDGPTGHGSVISGATTDTLMISNAQPADVGVYDVVITSSFGSATSASATLTLGNCVIVVTGSTSQAFLDGLTTVGGILMENVPDRPTLLLPALTGLGGTMRVAGNAGLTTLQAQMLATIGGDLEISNNPLLGEVDFSSLGGIGGDFTVANNNDPQIDFSSLGGVGGDFTVTNNNDPQIDFSSLGGVGGDFTVTNSNDPQIDFSSLGGVGGDFTVTNNNQTTPFTVAALQTIGGHLSIRNNLLLPSVHMPLLTQVVGNVDISNDALLGEADFGSLSNVGGSVTVTNNDHSAADFGSLSDIGGSVTVEDNDHPVADFGSLSNLGGSVTVTNNDHPTVDFGSLSNVGGSVTVTNNDQPPPLDLSSLETVGGDVTLETAGQSDVDLSGAAVAGSTDVSAEGATSVAVQVPGGTTSVEMCNDAACMDADLPDDAAPAGTPFAVLCVDPQTLTRVPGLDETGQPAGVDPVAAYAFTLGAPLQGPASLVFELTLASLSPEEQAAVLDAYTDGRLTLTVQADAPGSVPQARAQCGPADPLVADGCVKVGAFDALGFQLPPGVTAGAVTIRIAALVSHFSTYAVSIVTGRGDMNCDGEIDLADVEPFVQALTDPAAYAAAHPSCPALGADMNQDGAADGRDLQSFVNMVVVP